MKVFFSNIIRGRQAKITGLATCIFQNNSLARITILFAEICYAIEYIGVLVRIGPRKSPALCTGHGRGAILVATKLIVILIFRKVLFTNTNISI